MPASDYVVLKHGFIDINEGTGQNFSAPIPPAFNSSISPVLLFNMHPLTSHRVKFRVGANDFLLSSDNDDPTKRVVDYDEDDDIRLRRSIHEAFPVSLINPGSNFFRFQVDAGKVRFQEIVLFFHVNAF